MLSIGRGDSMIMKESMINHTKVACRFSPRETADTPSCYGIHAWIRIDYVQNTK
jgi:hypothetical protein